MGIQINKHSFSAIAVGMRFLFLVHSCAEIETKYIVLFLVYEGKRVLDRPTQTPLCGFYGSDEFLKMKECLKSFALYVFVSFISFRAVFNQVSKLISRLLWFCFTRL